MIKAFQLIQLGSPYFIYIFYLVVYHKKSRFWDEKWQNIKMAKNKSKAIFYKSLKLDYAKSGGLALFLYAREGQKSA